MYNPISLLVRSLVTSGLAAVDRAYIKRPHLQRALKDEAVAETLAFIRENMTSASYFQSKRALLTYAMEAIEVSGLYLEFGVYKGGTINHIASQTASPVHGFDSFEGLPSKWLGTVKMNKKMSLNGSLPTVRDNVTLHKGWFEDTLPEFLKTCNEPLAFAHIDCVIYSSTKTVLDQLAPRLQSGTIIVFDEYFGYWGWQQHEHKAFCELLQRANNEIEYIGFSEQQLAVKIR